MKALGGPGLACVRCGKPAPFPALSRWDNFSLLCSGCGTAEAMLQYSCDGDQRHAVLHPVTGFQPWATPPKSTR